MDHRDTWLAHAHAMLAVQGLLRFQASTAASNMPVGRRAGGGVAAGQGLGGRRGGGLGDRKWGAGGGPCPHGALAPPNYNNLSFAPYGPHPPHAPFPTPMPPPLPAMAPPVPTALTPPMAASTAPARTCAVHGEALVLKQGELSEDVGEVSPRDGLLLRALPASHPSVLRAGMHVGGIGAGGAERGGVGGWPWASPSPHGPRVWGLGLQARSLSRLSPSARPA